MSHWICFVLIGPFDFAGLPPVAASLSSRAFSRAKSGFRPNTQRNYSAMFRLFLGFCVFIGISLNDLSVGTIMAFMEFLVANGASFSSVANHVSAVKAMLGLYNFPVDLFSKPKIKLFIKSVQINRPLNLSQAAVIQVDLLHKIVTSCDSMYMGQVYKALYLLAYFSFMRLSNLVPHSLSQYDPSRHLARGDVIKAGPSLKVIIKWSKTLQTRDRIKCVDIPCLGTSPICPLQALKVLLSLVPKGRNSPLFQVKSNGQWQVLTDSKVRYHFSLILKKLGLSGKGYSFHSFRRSGASYAFNHHVSLQDIQSHGTWTSDSVWRYLIQDQNSPSQVSLTFQQNLATSTTP